MCMREIAADIRPSSWSNHELDRLVTLRVSVIIPSHNPRLSGDKRTRRALHYGLQRPSPPIAEWL
jgi:hypothetical protein